MSSNKWSKTKWTNPCKTNNELNKKKENMPKPNKINSEMKFFLNKKEKSKRDWKNWKKDNNSRMLIIKNSKLRITSRNSISKNSKQKTRFTLRWKKIRLRKLKTEDSNSSIISECISRIMNSNHSSYLTYWMRISIPWLRLMKRGILKQSRKWKKPKRGRTKMRQGISWRQRISTNWDWIIRYLRRTWVRGWKS